MAKPTARTPQGPCIIIPARFASTRFPGKPLAQLRGEGGISRSLIEWSWRSAKRVEGVERVVVATDDRRIAEEVERFGGAAVMTPNTCANGTERCAAAIADMPCSDELVINFQGDAPLTPPAMVSAVIDRMRAEPELPMATPAIPCRGPTYDHLIADRAAGLVGGTTVVFTRQGHALYFSKNIIPFVPPNGPRDDVVHLHLGIYGYRRDALLAYRAAAPSSLEELEGLEQLRFLDIGSPVGIVLCEPPEGTTIELNNPSDVVLVERELQRRGL